MDLGDQPNSAPNDFLDHIDRADGCHIVGRVADLGYHRSFRESPLSLAAVLAT